MSKRTLLISRIFLLCVLLPSFTQCRKYEDGPTLSLTSRTERVSNTWIIIYAEEDNKNVSDDYDQYELYLNSDNYAELEGNYTAFGINYQTSTTGVWNFEKDDELLKLNFEEDEQDGLYQILRLTNDELWIRNIDNDIKLHLLEK